MQTSFEESAEVPTILPRLCELIVVVAFWAKQSLGMYWGQFLSGDPVRIDYEEWIWTRLHQIRVAIGDDEFQRAVKSACIEFLEELESHTGRETARALWTVFSCGDSTQRHAAGLLMQQHTSASNRAYRDKRLRELLSHIKRGSDEVIPREIRLQMQRIGRVDPSDGSAFEEL